MAIHNLGLYGSYLLMGDPYVMLELHGTELL